jgi:glutathione synthase/RimK-type ligase-like ATP-grasp enzyme
MNVVFVVNRLSDWPFDVPGASVVTARAYLADSAYAGLEPARVVNLCATDRYQGRGFYVSLVAQARGHQAMPDVKTIEDCDAGLAPAIAANGGEAPAWTLHAGASNRIDVDAYFGRDPKRSNDAVAERLFNALRAPLVRASFELIDAQWRLRRVRLLGAANIPLDHRPIAAEAAAGHVAPAMPRAAKATAPSIAILYDDDEPDPPSNPDAISRFRRVAREMGMHCEILRRDDIGRLPQFDALFIRDTTHLGQHYTWQFARRAAALGMVVIDDPDSILKCNNKVYLNEILTRHRLPVPKTMIVHRDNVGEILPALGLPCIVKQPDGAFSNGVTKVETEQALGPALDAYFERSELVVAQQWLPTDFDWRVGVLDQRPLYVCKYLMAPGHWQVIKRERGRKLEGATIALAVGEAPAEVVNTAVGAANLIGDGFYGVDLKQVGGRAYVIEVNDNPNVDAGNEDGVLKDALYREIMGVFLRRVRERDRVRTAA